MINILITGANSYIGTSFQKYMSQWPTTYHVDTLDMLNPEWEQFDFSKYDTVFHVAGIAHVDTKKITLNQQSLYYKVNTELTIKTAIKAKSSGVKQFIFMSSSIVYGNCAAIGKSKIITADTPVCPANFYGDSKVQAEKGILPLNDNTFKVAILRPPVIYGKNSKGNYPILSKIAKTTPIFPYISNQKSMLYIENLTAFIKLVIDNKSQGIFFPQNKEYANTSELVRLIASVNQRKVFLLKGFAWSLKFIGNFTDKISKAFGNFIYDNSLSNTFDRSYCKKTLEESIKETEGFV